MRFAQHKTVVVVAASLAVLCSARLAAAQVETQSLNPNAPGTPILFPSSSSSYNQQGFNLPTTPRATGQDVVRGAGGISCQSAIGSGGPSLDLGVIGTNDIYSRESAALYGRVTIPLGKRPKRVDCTRLYELEVSRLKLELEMMRTAQTNSARLDAQPVMFEDAAPAQTLDFGDRVATAVSKPPEPGGFVLTGAAQGTDLPIAQDMEAEPLAPNTTPVHTPPADPRTVQIAAFRTPTLALKAQREFSARLSLPVDSALRVRTKQVGTVQYHTVQVTGLSEWAADAVCADLNGECLRLW